MRCLLCIPLFVTAALAPLAADKKDEAIFEPGAKLKVESAAGSGGEGPAWHPKLGVLTCGNGHVMQLDRNGKSRIYRKDAGTNGLLFDKEGRLLACEPARRRVTTLRFSMRRPITG
jgi:gluconolactonase